MKLIISTILLCAATALVITSCNDDPDTNEEEKISSLNDIVGNYEIELQKEREQNNGISIFSSFDTELTITPSDTRFLFQTTDAEIDFIVEETSKTDTLLYFRHITSNFYVELFGSYNFISRRLEGSSYAPGNGPGINYYFDFIVPE